MKRSVYLWVAALLLLGACAGDPERNDAATADSASVWVEDLEYALLPTGARVLSGMLVNETGEEIRNAQIEVSLFDADNRRVETMQIPVQGVGPGQRKAFREHLDTDFDVRSVRVRSILFL